MRLSDNMSTAAARFAVTLTINYEDTDAGGIVYYGNYLGYMERARNACLRQLGFSPSMLRRAHSTLFVVTEAHLKYRSPARLDDEIEVTLESARLKRASMVFAQLVRRDNQVLVEAEIKLALVHSETGKPRRMPAALADALLRRFNAAQPTGDL